MTTVQWFPGHMAKARRQVTEQLKFIDVVMELVDARLPLSSRNPMIDEIIALKPRLVLLNKADLADEEKNKEWIAYFENLGITCLAIDSLTGKGLNRIYPAAKELTKERFDRMREKGIKPRAIRALIVGIPNVGKSTIINRLAGKNIAKTGDRPGVTKAQQWIKVGKEMELLDTPGILWPKFEDQEVGMRLAVTGAIKDAVLYLQDIALFALNYLCENYPERLKERYRLTHVPTSLTEPDDIVAVFDEIGNNRGAKASGDMVDYEKVANLVLREVRDGKLGRLTLESPPTEEETDEEVID